MSLKKIFERSGQVTTEYFILLVLLAVVTVLGSSTFYKQTRDTMGKFTNTAVNKMGLNTE